MCYTKKRSYHVLDGDTVKYHPLSEQHPLGEVAFHAVRSLNLRLFVDGCRSDHHKKDCKNLSF